MCTRVKPPGVVKASIGLILRLIRLCYPFVLANDWDATLEGIDGGRWQSGLAGHKIIFAVPSRTSQVVDEIAQTMDEQSFPSKETAENTGICCEELMHGLQEAAIASPGEYQAALVGLGERKTLVVDAAAFSRFILNPHRNFIFFLLCGLP